MKTNMRNMVQPALEMMDFERTNRVPEMAGLKECSGEIMKGRHNIWYEYVPQCYDGTSPVPLVVQVHGGGHDGKRWANMTIWHELAERKGFIAVYPNSPEYGCWPCEEEDIRYLYDLIQLLCEKYAVDRSRIYMQGMSNGDMMTLAFSMRYPEVLAGAGYMSGPSAEEILDGDRPSGALPIVQMRGELDVNWGLTPGTEDVFKNRYEINDLNRKLWEDVNGIKGQIPSVSIRGKDNFLLYRGEKAPVIQWEIQGMGHREPVYGAQVLWDYLYAGTKRVNGQLSVDAQVYEKIADIDTVMIAAGSNKAYRSGAVITFGEMELAAAKIVLPTEGGHFCPVQLEEMCETEVMCVPAEFFVKAYGAELAYFEARDRAELKFPDGTCVKLLADSLLLEVNGQYQAMQKPCFLRCGVFYVPAEEFCRMVLGKQVSFADDVMCITDHYAVLGKYTARTVRELLGGSMRPRKRPEWK